MKATVTELYRGGVRFLDPALKGKSATGELDLSSHLNPLTRRYTRTAILVGSDGSSLLEAIHDVALVSIAGHGLRLRGMQFRPTKNGLIEECQEWWCTFEGGENGASRRKEMDE